MSLVRTTTARVPRQLIAGALGFSACIASAVLTTSLAFGGGTEAPTGPRPTKYAVNESGMTYGSDFGQSASPDLILAQGDGGTSGYVKREDVYGSDDVTREDVLREMESGNNEARTILLYASDGVTVVGSFTLPAATSGSPDQ